MTQTVIDAMGELLDLLRENKPLWIKSSIDERFMIDRETYNRHHPKDIHFFDPLAWVESSREFEIVSMSAMNFLEIFKNPEKLMDFFPTIVTKARIVEELDTGGRGGFLYLLHVLSPFVAPREFMFFRYIQQLSPTIWLIVQVSGDLFNEEMPTSQAWMLPSGCMIEDLSKGQSKVTWIEHVEVDDNSLTHQMYKDVVRHSYAYGAKRWLVTLERMCERHAFSIGSKAISGHPLERIIDAPESRTRMTNLANKMVRSFHGILSMKERSEITQLSKFHNEGFQISFRISEFDLAGLTTLCVVTSIHLPVSFENLFDFFKKDEVRPQWDVLSNGNPIREIPHISVGDQLANSISLMQQYVTLDNTEMIILQESCIDKLGASLIYAPIELWKVKSIIKSEDNMKIPMIPSGFVITSDQSGVNDGGISLGSASSSSGPSISRSNKASLLTIALQVVATPDTALEIVSTFMLMLTPPLKKLEGPYAPKQLNDIYNWDWQCRF